MPLKKELFEYVKLTEPTLVNADLQDMSLSLSNAMDEVQQALNVQQTKHLEIGTAKNISKEILTEIKLLNEDLLKLPFKEAIGKAKAIEPLPRINLRAEGFAPEKLNIGGKEAIKHLHKNLIELKKVLAE